MTDEDPVLLERDGGVAIVSLNRPHRHNAANDAMDERLWEILASLHADAALRCVVIRGEGKSLSSGRDTAELGIRAVGVSDLEYIQAGHERTRMLWSFRCPTIVAMKGWILGGWFERSLLCDIRIASDDARMGLPEVGHGMVPDTGGTTRLFQIAGPSVAADLALTGRVIDATEALQYGLVSRVTAPEDLDRTVRELADAIAASAPLAVQFVKRILANLSVAQTELSMFQELLAQMTIYGSQDLLEARQARLEQRAPSYRGR